jgi:hypothetical protein
MAGNFYKGKFCLHRPEKYMGNKSPVYRSSWEAKFFWWLENNKNVIKWESEPPKMKINYKLPDGSSHVYTPDVYVEMRTNDGRIKPFLVEIKPSAESPRHSPVPSEPKRKTNKAMSNYRTRVKTYFKNKSKWAATEEWCKKRGITFIVYTEIESGGAFNNC